MMFIFVRKSELPIEDASHPVQVIASYSEEQNVMIHSHGEECTILTLPQSAVTQTTPPMAGMPALGQVLMTGWRTDYVPIVNGEASRRIELVFPAFKQRNATAAIQEWITTYGTTVTTWPAQCQAFKTEADRGWTYIQAVRDVANAFTSLPVDPTDDALWPPAISPITLPPVVQ